jgi:hypothetical protein
MQIMILFTTAIIAYFNIKESILEGGIVVIGIITYYIGMVLCLWIGLLFLIRKPEDRLPLYYLIAATAEWLLIYYAEVLTASLFS